MTRGNLAVTGGVTNCADEIINRGLVWVGPGHMQLQEPVVCFEDRKYILSSALMHQAVESFNIKFCETQLKQSKFAITLNLMFFLSGF